MVSPPLLAQWQMLSEETCDVPRPIEWKHSNSRRIWRSWGETMIRIYCTKTFIFKKLIIIRNSNWRKRRASSFGIICSWGVSMFFVPDSIIWFCLQQHILTWIWNSEHYLKFSFHFCASCFVFSKWRNELRGKRTHGICFQSLGGHSTPWSSPDVT